MAILAYVAALALVLSAYLVGFKRGRKRAPVVTRAPVQVLPSGSSEKNLEGQVAIVTGGGTGLGRAMSLELARRGAKVVLASRNPEHLESTAKEVRDAGGEALCFSLDVRKSEDVDAMVKQVVEKFGKVDMLVNNAAGNFLWPAEKMSQNQWNSVTDIVLKGTWNCTSAVGKQMIAQGGGQILNIVANYAWSGQPGVVHSCSAKAAVLAMTRTLAVEWAGYGIRTNAFAPGAMVTDGASANLKYDSPEAQEMIRKIIPVQRLSSAEEMGRLAVFMLSPECSYVNGEVFTADGGANLPRGFLDFPQFDQLRKM
jgi:NAD(P)-dependent dehydrogenase (short-subunit alcohol dehydrogenase family)